MKNKQPYTSLFEADTDYWRLQEANKICCLIDGEDYFSALHQAIIQAEHAIYIIGWDIHSQFNLIRNPEKDRPDANMPSVFRELLEKKVSHAPNLNVYILVWDFSPILTFDREPLQKLKFDFLTEDRIHFRMHKASAVGASHHQKIVVVDDSLAFCGGLDITHGRWDSSEHDLKDKRRIDIPGGKIPRPYHDVQFMVNGDCAKSLGDLARTRWTDATDQILQPCAHRDLWIPDITPDFLRGCIAISLTVSRSEKMGEKRQIEQSLIKMIRIAEKIIYIENQYFTSKTICEALQARLMEKSGPEVVIVTGRSTDGWLSQNSMDLLRCYAIRKLKSSDKYNRFKIYYPELPGSTLKTSLNVHAKLMIIDDKLLRVGSANLNDRSMGLDTECDLTLISTSIDQSMTIAKIRNKLISEHLGYSNNELDFKWKGHSLINFIEKHNGNDRKLVDLGLTSIRPEPLPINDELLDPKSPIDEKILKDILIPHGHRKNTSVRLSVVTVTLICLLILFFTIKLGVLNGMNMEDVHSILASIHEHPLAPLGSTLFIVLVATLGLPLTLIITSVMVILGVVNGIFYSLIGSVLSGIISFKIGEFLGHSRLEKIPVKNIQAISKKIANKGVLTIALIRLIPIAPFTVVNLVAGASHIKLRDFIIGTCIGLLPCILGLSIITSGVLKAAYEPTIQHVSLMLFSIGALILASFGLRYWLSEKRCASKK